MRGLIWFDWMIPQINMTERTLLKKIDHCTLLLESCIMSSYFEPTISDCIFASILYFLWVYLTWWLGVVLPPPVDSCESIFSNMLNCTISDLESGEDRNCHWIVQEIWIWFMWVKQDTRNWTEKSTDVRKTTITTLENVSNSVSSKRLDARWNGMMLKKISQSVPQWSRSG